MTGYLLDTSVLSVFAPDKPAIPNELAAWMEIHGDAAFVPAIAVAEIEQGMSKLRRAGGTARAERLAKWLDALVTTFGDRVLAVDAAVARRAGAISDQARAQGRHPGMADVLIAATADVHGLVLLTRNVRHFASLGVEVIDPVEKLPGPRNSPDVSRGD